MARPRRLDVPRLPQHVIVRGVDRKPCFLAHGDFAAYLDDLSHSSRQCECSIHAYVLMTNHVHLLVTGDRHGAISRLMQSVGRKYVRRFNASWRRTGSLFEGRFRASIVESERYLLTCMRYIELNPVRAGMVTSPFDYPWSSLRANAGLRRDALVTPHDEYRNLGRTDDERAHRYRAIMAQGVAVADLETIRRHVNRDSVLGSGAFRSVITGACGQAVGAGARSLL
jgi:putative transposase